MDRRSFLLSGAALLPIALHAQAETSKLEVQVNYTGAGTVDESRKIYVALWDTPDFVKGDAGGPPLDTKTVSSKSDLAQFNDVQKNPVYVSMLYDPTGKWDGASMPPPGASVGLYSKEPGTPAPIQLSAGKTTKITATFDDSIKMH